MDMLDGLKAFVATAQTRSFTLAADRLGISNRLTSKYVAELEKQLGARLLQRTTRKVGLTPAGEALLARAPALLDDLDDMVGAVRDEGKGFSGLLRLSAPTTFGEMYISDMIRRFAAIHPELVVDLRLTDEYVDLAREGIDLAFRVGELQVSSLKKRQVGVIRSVAVASPDYLRRAGTPSHPNEVAEHTCIVDTNRRDPQRWIFWDEGKEISVTAPKRYLVNSARIARDWALAGEGLAFCPDFVVNEDIEKGNLVELLTRYQSPITPINLVYLEGHVLPQKVRALIDFAAKDFSDKQCP